MWPRLVLYWIFCHLSAFVIRSFLHDILHHCKNCLLTTKSYNTFLHLRSWFFMLLSLPILTATLALGSTLMKELIGILAHYIMENNTYSQNDHVNCICHTPVWHPAPGREWYTALLWCHSMVSPSTESQQL